MNVNNSIMNKFRNQQRSKIKVQSYRVGTQRDGVDGVLELLLLILKVTSPTKLYFAIK